METDELVRLDKWLWAARFYKTRSIAKQMIETGKVEYNGQRCKTSRIVELGATIKLKQGFDNKTIIVKGISDQRRCYKEAVLLYEETEESIQQKKLNEEQRKLNCFFSPHPDEKPNKKQRRELLKIKSEFY